MTISLNTTLGIDVTIESIEVTMIRLDGELVARSAPDVRRVVEAAVEAAPRSVVIDLDDVVKIDTAGLMAVTAPAMQARRASIAVTIVPPGASEALSTIDRVGVLPMLNRPVR